MKIQITDKEYNDYYKALYVTDYKIEDLSIIINGTYTQIFKINHNEYEGSFGLNDFEELLIYLISYPFDYIFVYLPLLFKRLKENAEKPIFIPEEHNKLDKNKHFYIEDEYVMDQDVAIKECNNSLKDKYNTNRKSKEEKANAINTIRKYLYSNKFTLKAKKLPNGCITFHELNNDLSTIFPELITLKKDFFSGTMWIENLNVEALEKKLKSLLQINLNVSIS